MLHYLIKRFLYEHSGFERSQIQAYLNLYAFVLNPPRDKLEKVDILLNLVFQNPKLLRYRDRFTENRGAQVKLPTLCKHGFKTKKSTGKAAARSQPAISAKQAAKLLKDKYVQ